MITCLAIVAVWAEDVAQAAHFYRGVLGLRLAPHHSGGRPHFDLGGVILTILKGRPMAAQDAEPSRCRGGPRRTLARAGSCSLIRPAT